MEIRVDDLRGSEVAELLREHLESMHRFSPPESVHALDLEALRRPDITFWTAWRDGDLAGCAALRELEAGHGEIKSMRTARAHLRSGVASALLRHVLTEARRRAYRQVSLETGSGEAFLPARELYRSFGFVPCAPFGDYVDDAFSVFLTLRLAGGAEPRGS